MDIKIDNSDYIIRIDSEENFKIDPYYTPRVSKVLKINYEVAGESLSTEVNIGTTRADVYCESLNTFMRNNNYSELNLDVWKDALEYTNKKIKTLLTIHPELKNDDLLSDVVSLYKEPKNKKAIDLSVDMIKKIKNPKLLSTVVKDISFNTSNVNTFLYYIVSKVEFEKDDVSIDLEYEVKHALAYDLLSILSLRNDKHNLETIDGVLDFIEYLCDVFGYCNLSAKGIVKEQRKINRVFNTLDDETLINFIRDNVPESDIMCDLESNDVVTLEELLKLYKETPYNQN